jgi:hypothetical protein
MTENGIWEKLIQFASGVVKIAAKMVAQSIRISCPERAA